MLRCPKCLAEYRDGYSNCSDCNVHLIEVVDATEPPIVKNEPRQVFLVNVHDSVELSYITSLLQEAGIWFRITYEDCGQYLEIKNGQSFLGKNIFILKEYELGMDIVNSYKSPFLPGSEELVAAFEYNTNSVTFIKAYTILYMVVSLILFGYV